MEVDDTDVPPTKRFKHQSYNEQLKQVHLPSALSQFNADDEIEETSSHFYAALTHWLELNLAPSFQSFARKANPLSQSLALLLYHWREVVELWTQAVDSADDEGLKALLDLLQKLAHDLRLTLLPVYKDLLPRLLIFLPRSISADALTALLSTFSALFKFLLIPSCAEADTENEHTTEPDLLAFTWTELLGVLPKCNPEVQRAAAETWAFVLRRLKPDTRDRCVKLMVLDDPAKSVAVEDALAWMFVFASKSLADTLHTCTLSLLASLLQSHLDATNTHPEFTEKLIRRMLTALIHHCSKAEQFESVAEHIVQTLEGLVNRTSTSEPVDQSVLQRMLQVATVPCSVRKGSRLKKQQISRILIATAQIQPSEPNASLVNVIVASLVSSESDLTLWIGPGRRVLEQAWASSHEFAITLTGALVESKWGGLKQIALPLVIKHASHLEGEDGERRLKTLRLFALLAAEGLLDGVDAAWKETTEQWVRQWLDGFTISESSVIELQQVLSLSSILQTPTVLPGLIKITLAILHSETDARIEYQENWANEAWVFGACLQRLSAIPWLQLSKGGLVATELLEKGLAKWSWSECAMSGLSALMKNHPRTEGTIPLEEIYDPLKEALVHHSHNLRLSALRILSSPLVSSSAGCGEVLKRGILAEQVPLTVQSARERVLYTGRIGQGIQTGHDELPVDLCVRWLLGQLKVNLRPLWNAAAQSISTFSIASSETVWPLILQEIQWTCSPAATDVIKAKSSWHPVGDSPSEAVADDPREEERSWRDPSAYKIRVAVKAWTSMDSCRSAIIQEQVSSDRLDLSNYEALLLATLGSCPSMAERHGRDIVPIFLSFASPSLESKPPRKKLMHWLSLFSKFSNPKALHSASTIHSIYVALISHPDKSLQVLALTCLLTFKSPSLTPYEGKLRALLDDTKWRDEIAALDFSEIEAKDRGELVPVIIRLFFGMMLEKKGSSKGTNRRAAVLGALGACEDRELDLLVDLMLEPFLDVVEQGESNRPWTLPTATPGATEKQQVGLLTLLEDLLRHLGSRVVAQWPRLLSVILSLTAEAQRRLETVAVQTDQPEDSSHEDGDAASGSLRALRTVRQLGLKRLTEFFRSPIQFDFTPYMAETFRTIISPRLGNLDVENTQSPSAMLELFNVWTHRRETALLLVRYDDRTLPKVYDCLIAPSVKPAVVTRIFEMIERLLALSKEDEEVSSLVLKPHMSTLLSNVATLVQRTPIVGSTTTPLAHKQIAILSELAPYLTDGVQASTLLTLFDPLLRKPHKAVSDKIKADILKIVCNLLPLVPDISNREAQLFHKTFETFSRLFQILRARQARLHLVDAFRQLVKCDEALLPLADLLASLNAYSAKRMDEPDFDRRLTAFTTLNEDQFKLLTPMEWIPILHTMLNFIQDENELSIRNNASFTMKRFIETVSKNKSENFHSPFIRVLYPGLKRCLHSKHELVRAEVIGVIAFAVVHCGDIASLQEMRLLLAGGDEEANFFNNIHHIQIHRRNRALRRLADNCDEGHLRSTTLSEVFVPLVSSFILASQTTDHHLVNEAVLTIGRIAKHLSWGAYYSLVQQYLRLSTGKGTTERAYVRTLVAILENFHFPMDDTITSQDLATEAIDEDDEADDAATNTATKPSVDSRISDAVNDRLLPSLLKHLEQRDEMDDSVRIPIAVGIANVARHLPESLREPQISKLLTVLSQILRSKSQETRDLTRETLCKIVSNLGTTYLGSLVREMRMALLRGPQLHVLAYTTHALLVFVTSPERVQSLGNIDEFIPDIVHVSAEVIFGQSGKDVQSEEFKTKMREVRGSAAKGMDSFAILAKYITPSAMAGLLSPIKAIMQETESAKVTQQIDEVLRRIAGGLNANSHFGPAETLVLSHTLISQNAKFLTDAQRPQGKKRKQKNDHIVENKRRITIESDHFAHNSYRFVCFGIDLFITAFRRGRFDFQDAKVISRLEPMVSVIGNTLYSGEGAVVALGLKAAASIVRCPLKSIDKSLPVFVKQALEIVKQSGSTESETTQTAFKSLATIIRDCPAAQVKEKDLTFLLESVSPDLEEPTRQAPAFSLLRAIVSRKFVVPEIYDLMDRVSEIMVTSQSSNVQELCRGVLLQFLLDYPQGKGRLKKQMTFLAKNLSYVYESGRRSVMELLNAVITKFQDALIQEYADLLFVALVMVVANDDASKCREMAAQLTRSLVLRLSDAQRKMILGHAHAWASQDANPALSRVSAQVYGLIVDALQGDAKPHLLVILKDIKDRLDSAAVEMSQLEESEDNHADESAAELEWQTPYHALAVLAKIFTIFPDTLTRHEASVWPTVVRLLLYPHAWVRTSASRLLGTLFAATPVSAPDPNLPDDMPLSLEGMKGVAKALCAQLKSEHLDAALGTQVVKNLFYVGKCFCLMAATTTGGDGNTDGAEVAEENAGGEEGDSDGGSGSEDEPDDNTKGQNGSSEPKNDNPLPWLFSRLSYQARSAQIARRNKRSHSENWAEQPSAILKWFATMTSHMAATQVERYLPHMLSPVYRITEDDTIRDAHMDELKSLASELQDLIQAKVGTTAFAQVYNRIRQSVLGVRRERRTARAVEVATNPEKAAKRKMQHNVVKKESKKRKNRDYTDTKIRNNALKRHRHD
ncbi:hypothetical protein BD410DRAFT_769374 [Rickenella mellea]|uniref:Uncharacterized protein n=1 Tax=Rickenella mellea TaxID=50990 RepID=A0A4Y7Q5Y4_9AGAM|nr:hypothetical protein BD410DRAFT_769374 [Rickenella mellea]